MNIFFLDKNPVLAARYHCDKHVVKMCVEYAQLLSQAVRILNPELCTEDFPYRITHKNHPCAIWTRSKVGNFLILRELAVELGSEFEIRYGKKHKSIELIEKLPFPTNLTMTGFDSPPQCVPDDCKNSDVVTAYRNYYMMHKRHFATWKTQQPYWWK